MGFLMFPKKEGYKPSKDSGVRFFIGVFSLIGGFGLSLLISRVWPFFIGLFLVGLSIVASALNNYADDREYDRLSKIVAGETDAPVARIVSAEHTGWNRGEKEWTVVAEEYKETLIYRYTTKIANERITDTILFSGRFPPFGYNTGDEVYITDDSVRKNVEIIARKGVYE